MQEPADDDIKLRRRAQRKFPRVAALQPEDSAEQLSSMPMPSRPFTAAQSASTSQQLTQQPNRVTVASGTASMQPAGPVRQTVSSAFAPADIGSSAVSGPAPSLQQTGSLVQQHISLSNSSRTQEGPASGPLTDADVVAESSNDPAAAAQQSGSVSTSNGAFRQKSGRQSSSLGEVPNLSEASGREALAAGDLLFADAPEQQEQQEGVSMQMVQQLGLTPQHAEAAAPELRASVDVEPQASTSQSSRPQQALRGESVYAPRDLTVLEQYEADIVHAYATSFLAEAVMQGMLPAAANSAAAERHAKLLTEVRQRNALNKARHLEEVQEERAAWEAHEQNLKR